MQITRLTEQRSTKIADSGITLEATRFSGGTVEITVKGRSPLKQNPAEIRVYLSEPDTLRVIRKFFEAKGWTLPEDMKGLGQ